MQDPGQIEVPSGYWVSLFAEVLLGTDNTASQIFVYDENSTVTAKYVISGTTFDNELGLVSVE